MKIYEPSVVRTEYIGAGTKIGAFSDIGIDVEIGCGCNIQAGVYLSNGVKVGDGVFIGPRVTVLNDLYMNGCLQPPRIGNYTRIGGGTIILPNVNIGDNVFICAGALITRDVPDGVKVLPEKGGKRRVVW